MRKYLLLHFAGAIALAAMLIGCQTEREFPEVDITAVRCSIAQIDVEEDFATGRLDTLSTTKGSFSGNYFLWAEGDKIGIVPNSGAQIYFSVNDGAGTSTARFDGGDWAMKSTGTFYAYYPLYPDIFLSKDHVPVSYTGQIQSGNNNSLHTGDYWTLYTEGTTAVGNTLDFSFNHLTSFFKTYVTVPAGTYTKIAFSAPSDVFIKDGYFDLSAQTPKIVGTTFTDELCLDLQNVTFTEETELIGLLVVAPVDIAGIPITVTVYKDEEATYEYSLTKANPMAPGKAYAFRATSLTRVVASVAQANALFASGETSVTITEPLSEDATIVLPNTEEAVILTLPTTASSSTLTVSYAQDAIAYPATLAIAGPEGSNLDIYAPNSTVTVNGVSYNQITSRTAANTCIISEGVTVNVLKVIQGGVQVYGTVSQIDLSEQDDDCIVNVSGTVDALLGEDDEEYIPATSVSLNKSSINLNVGDSETLTTTVAPVGAYPNVIWSSSDDAVATVTADGVVTGIAEGSAIITATTVYGGFTASCTVSVNIASTINGHSYVDIGLRKSHIDSRITPGSAYDRKIVFATSNIGAESPEGFGYYFRWGELNGWKINNTSAPNEWGQVFILSATQHDKNGNALSDIWNASTFSDSYALYDETSLDDYEDYKGKTNLQYNGTVYGDAATYNWGEPWVTLDYPTLYALLGKPTGNITLSNGPVNIVVRDKNGSITLTYSYTEQNGVIGLLIENRSISTSIFIPAGGFCLDDQLRNSGSYNDMGALWCSSKGAFSGGAYYMQFNFDILYSEAWANYIGKPIRPVAELTLTDDVPDVAVLPILGNVEIQSVDYTQATISSSLVSDGNAITEFGFYYGSSAESMNTKVVASVGARGYSTGDFSKVITGLTPGTTYYVKAYATNEAGTVESDVVSFTTIATTGTLNGYDWVDIGIRKSHYVTSIEPGSSADRRIVFAIKNIGASDQYDDGYYFRGNELYGWDYTGSTTSYTGLTSANLSQKDNAGSVLKTWNGESFYWNDDYDFVIQYSTGDAIQYYLGNGWKEIPYELAQKLSTSTGYYSTLPSTATTTNTAFTGLSLVYSFNSSGRNSLTITNQDLGTSVFLPGGHLSGYYYPGEGYGYWVEGEIKEIYGGGVKHSFDISKTRSGSNYDPDMDDYTTWEYGWSADGYYSTDCYSGLHIRAIAELPL